MTTPSARAATEAAFDSAPFEDLAAELAQRDRSWSSQVPVVRDALAGLRERAALAIGAFAKAASARSAAHLTDLQVGPVEPDEKHVDCLQFKVRRGRFEVVCVGKPRGVVTMVGPYRAGRPERPCQEHPLPSVAACAALDALLLEFLRTATQV